MFPSAVRPSLGGRPAMPQLPRSRRQPGGQRSPPFPNNIIQKLFTTLTQSHWTKHGQMTTPSYSGDWGILSLGEQPNIQIKILLIFKKQRGTDPGRWFLVCSTLSPSPHFKGFLNLQWPLEAIPRDSKRIQQINTVSHRSTPERNWEHPPPCSQMRNLLKDRGRAHHRASVEGGRLPPGWGWIHTAGLPSPGMSCPQSPPPFTNWEQKWVSGHLTSLCHQMFFCLKKEITGWDQGTKLWAELKEFLAFCERLVPSESLADLGPLGHQSWQSVCPGGCSQGLRGPSRRCRALWKTAQCQGPSAASGTRGAGPTLRCAGPSCTGEIRRLMLV